MALTSMVFAPYWVLFKMLCVIVYAFNLYDIAHYYHAPLMLGEQRLRGFGKI